MSKTYTIPQEKKQKTLSQINKVLCDVCGKVFKEKSRISFGEHKLITGECGHCITEDVLSAGATSYDIESLNHKYHPRGYQIEGIEFVEKSNARCLIADEQGLGKTIQALGTLRLHPELLPCLVITKTTVTHQWMKELIEWCGVEGYLCQVLKTGVEKTLPGFNVYITSFDILKNDDIFSMTGPPKTVIIDECQAIKNHLSGRAKAVQKVCASAEHIIALSGTPIKNNAGEYFTILNILQPTRFPTYQGYIDRFVDSYSSGQYEKLGGLKNPDLFEDYTSDFIIRRTRAEAAPDIPAVDRQFFHVELDKKLNTAYKEAMKELEELMYQSEDENTMTSIIAIMTKMRKITGISKVFTCVDFVTEFLTNEPTRKIVVFAHHKAAVSLLEQQLNQWLVANNYKPILNLHAGLNGDDRSRLVDIFREDPSRRVLVASTLAAGEALNLQFCSRAVMMERQWNPANEEQAEGRFARIGQRDNIVVTYMIASDTIDEYFTELVEIKRSIVKGTLDKQQMSWDQNSLMKELAETLISKGKKRWSL